MKANSRKKKTNKNTQSIWTKETIGVILVLFATLCMVCLITRDSVFSYPGQFINSFLLGCFGFFAYPVILFLAYVGGTMVIGKRIGMRKKKKAFLTLTFVLIALLSQVISMQSYTNTENLVSFGEYLSAAYQMGEGGIATASAAGVVTSLVSYLFASVLTNVGSYVVIGIALAVSLFFTVTEFKPIASQKKARPARKGAVGGFKGSFVKKDEQPQSAEQSIEQATAAKPHLFINNPQDFGVRSKRDIAKDKNGYDVLMGHSDNGLTVAYAKPEEKEVKQPTYSDNFKDKIDYIMTPTAINVEKVANQTYSQPFAPYYDRADVGGTTVSDYVKPREESSYVEPSAIPHTEHEESASFSVDSAENNAQRFSRYADVVDFGGGRISTRESDSVFRPIEQEQTEQVNEEQTAVEEIPFVEEVQEPTVNEVNSEPEIQTFEIKEEEPPQSILGSRRVRNIFNEEPEEIAQETTEEVVEEKVEEQPFELKSEEPAVEQAPPLSSIGFTSRVAADNNFGSRRSIFEPQSQPQQQVEPTPEPEKPKRPAPPINRRYNKPPLDLLETRAVSASAPTDNHEERMEIIQKTLEEFHINAVPQSYVQGPSITRYEIMMPAGISVKKVLNYDDDLKMRLAVRDGVRIEAPIPGKNLVGIEVANTNKIMVGLKEVMEGLAGKKVKESALMFALGKDIVGNSISDDLTKGPHYLIAGATGSGKSVALHVMIVSLLMRYSPEELKLVLVDPKSVEFRKYEHIPHLLVDEVVTEPKRALALLQWAYDETNRRNAMFTECGGMISNIEDYNTHIAGPNVAKLPRIVFIIDELADLMEACKKDLEARIRMIAAKSRSAGIHLVLATQRPSVDVITGTIKANLPSRIALKVMNYPDSQTILGEGGAEKLLGNGDMLYKNSSMADYERYQGAFISGREISNIVDYIKENNKAYFDEEIQEFLDKETRAKPEEAPVSEGKDDGSEVSELFLQALWLAINSQSASIAQFQRRFGIGYARAGGLIDKMERMGFVSGNEGSKARRVLISKEDYESRFGTPPETF